MGFSFHDSLLLLLLSSCARANYVWPSQYDQIEDMLAMHAGYRRFGFTDLVAPCNQGLNQVGVINAAEWIRTAFHDTITHSKSTGSGGLDASIMFELDRAENGGDAFNNTLGSMKEFINSRTSVSDMIALSVVASSGGCGGLRIPLRLGRIDATSAGPSGVPEPHTDLETTLATFANAGFSQEDMVGLVACGHTLGRVHSVNHPELVEGTPSDSNNADFDTTATTFDNRVVTEYFDNSTKNPLVVAKNDTLNSDKRIFASDRNATMQRMRDPAAFQKQCAVLFERMINTVPAGTKLSEPIEFADVKPYIDTLEMQEDGSIAFVGSVRVRTTAETGRNADDIEVSLQVKSEAGTVVATVPARRARLKGGQSQGFWGEEFTWFEFSSSLQTSTAIGAFDIQLNDARSKTSALLDNSGTGGYPLETKILYQQRHSCLDISSNPVGKLTVTAAIRKSESDQFVPRVLLSRLVPRYQVMIPKSELDTIEMNKTPVEKAGYVYYQAKIDVGPDSWGSTLDIRLNDHSGIELIKLSSLVDRSCNSL